MSKTISRNVNNIKRGQYAEKVLTMLQVYFENQNLCDVVLVAANDGTRVSAHRVVLSACSLHFMDLFTNNNERNEVQLEEVSGHVLEILIHFCYTGHIEFQKDNVEIFLDAATRLQLTDVVKACWDYLVQELSSSYCLKVAQIAEKYHCNDSQSQAESFTCTHYMEICGSDDFFQMSVDQLCKIIGSDDLVVNSEEDVFNSCISWIDHDRKNREMYFSQLLASVRLQLLPLHFINDQVKPLCKTIESKDLIIEAMTCLLQADKYTKPQNRIQPQKPTIISSPLIQPKIPTDYNLLAIGEATSYEYKYCTIHNYNNSEDEWNKWNLKLKLADFYCELDGVLLAIQGINGYVTSYDFKTPPVTTESPLKTPRNYQGHGVLGGYLYFVGGDETNSVERWNLKDRLWNCVASMNEKRRLLGVASLDGYLYAVGGFYKCYKNSVERYDPQTNEWTLRAPMNKARWFIQVASGNGYLYAVGGKTDNGSPTDTVERYDPTADKWTMICSISSARQSVACIFFGDRLMAVGGYNGKNYEFTVEEYDIETDQWTMKKPLPKINKLYTILTIPKTKCPTKTE